MNRAGFVPLAVMIVVLIAIFHPAPPSTDVGNSGWSVLTQVPHSNATLLPARIVPNQPQPGLPSTGGLTFAEAQVTITHCAIGGALPTGAPTGASGTGIGGIITNTDSQADDFIISLGTNAGEFGIGAGMDVAVTNLAPGASRSWTDRAYVTNLLSQQVTCSVLDVAAEPA